MAGANNQETRPGRGGGGAKGGADKRPSNAKQPQSTEATRVNAEQDTSGRERHTPGGLGGGGGHNRRRARDTTKQGGGRKTGWREGGGAQQQAANTSARPGTAQTEQARDHERQGDDTRETKTRGGAPHALGRPACPSRPGQRGGAPHALRRPARLSRCNTNNT